MSRIMIVGAGVVGRATGKGFLAHGHSVTFVDVDELTVSRLSGEGYTAIYPPDVNLAAIDVAFVSVTAPTEPYGIDLSCLEQACKSLGLALAECPSRPVIVFRCTIPPGTTRGFLVPLLESASGQKAGLDFGVCYNPEYLRAHSADHDFLHPRLVTIGQDPGVGEFAEQLTRIYRGFGVPIYHCTYEEAEFQKYVHNLFNATKISFFNEMRAVAEALGIDPCAIFKHAALGAQGMWDSLYGTRDDGPYAGACLPKDVGAWLSFAARKGLPAALVSAVREVNRMRGGT